MRVIFTPPTIPFGLMSEYQGTRLPDTPLGQIPDGANNTPGAYWKVLNKDGQPMHSAEPDNLTHTVWQVSPPVVGGIAMLTKHTVREHEDGTISVRPGDGSSNSIKVIVADKEFHGFIEHGVWRDV